MKKSILVIICFLISFMVFCNETKKINVFDGIWNVTFNDSVDLVEKKISTLGLKYEKEVNYNDCISIYGNCSNLIPGTGTFSFEFDEFNNLKYIFITVAKNNLKDLVNAFIQKYDLVLDDVKEEYVLNSLDYTVSEYINVQQPCFLVVTENTSRSSSIKIKPFAESKAGRRLKKMNQETERVKNYMDLL